MLKLQALELSKSYRGRKVVDDVELEIGQGEVVGLLGPNGAGKTTTFYILVGLARPDSGRVLLNGDEITDLPMYLRARSGISYLPQEPSVFRQLTSEENLKPSHFRAGNAAGSKLPVPSRCSLLLFFLTNRFPGSTLLR
jgi:lipopolysaccharide export system ATP-binding protein